MTKEKNKAIVDFGEPSIKNLPTWEDDLKKKTDAFLWKIYWQNKAKSQNFSKNKKSGLEHWSGHL